MGCKTLFGGHTVLVRYNKEVVRSKKTPTNPPIQPVKKIRARERVRELTDTWWEHQRYKNARNQTSSSKHQTSNSGKGEAKNVGREREGNPKERTNNTKKKKSPFNHCTLEGFIFIFILLC